MEFHKLQNSSRIDVCNEQHQHFEGDKGVKKHSWLGSLFHSVIAVQEGNKTVYLNKKSCINWVGRHGGDIRGLDRSSSTQLIQERMQAVLQSKKAKLKTLAPPPTVSRAAAVEQVATPSKENLKTLIGLLVDKMSKNPTTYREKGAFRLSGSLADRRVVLEKLYPLDNSQYATEIGKLELKGENAYTALLKKLILDFADPPHNGKVNELDQNTRTQFSGILQDLWNDQSLTPYPKLSNWAVAFPSAEELIMKLGPRSPPSS